MGIGREFAEFRENVLHSPRGEKTDPRKKISGELFFVGSLTHFSLVRSNLFAPTPFLVFVVRVRSHSTSSLAPSTKCKHVFNVSNCPTRSPGPHRGLGGPWTLALFKIFLLFPIPMPGEKEREECVRERERGGGGGGIKTGMGRYGRCK